MRSLARSRWILSVAVLCASLATGSAALAAGRTDDRTGAPGARAGSGNTVSPERVGPLTLHRVLREQLQRKLLRLAVQTRVVDGIGLLGLSDDPDPTGDRVDSGPRTTDPPGKIRTQGERTPPETGDREGEQTVLRLE